MTTKPSIYIREPTLADEVNFLETMQQSKGFHFPYTTAPQTSKEFQAYLQNTQIKFLALDRNENIIGVFNISEIVRGAFGVIVKSGV